MGCLGSWKCCFSFYVGINIDHMSNLPGKINHIFLFKKCIFTNLTRVLLAYVSVSPNQVVKVAMHNKGSQLCARKFELFEEYDYIYIMMLTLYIYDMERKI